MRTRLKEVQGVDWFDGAVMNCLWKGPRLRDVLLAVGLEDHLYNGKEYKGNVDFLCDAVPCEDAPDFGGSISLERAIMEEGDCILALEVCFSAASSTRHSVDYGR
jgi:sulfite oxidase